MTKKQRQLLSFIDKFTSEHGYSPSYREIMNSLGYKSVSTVATHIDNLITLGYLKKADHSARSLEVVDKEYDEPSLGKIAPTQEKWLISIIASKFAQAEVSKPTQQEADDLFVLVGALHVLGFKDAAASFKVKLKDYR